MKNCTDVGAAQETRSRTTCPTLCLIIPIKATYFLGCQCDTGQDICTRQLFSRNGFVLFPSANHFSISVRSSSGRLHGWVPHHLHGQWALEEVSNYRNHCLCCCWLSSRHAFCCCWRWFSFWRRRRPPEQRWKQQSALLLMIHQKAIS